MEIYRGVGAAGIVALALAVSFCNPSTLPCLRNSDCDRVLECNHGACKSAAGAASAKGGSAGSGGTSSAGHAGTGGSGGSAGSATGGTSGSSAELGGDTGTGGAL